MSTGKLLIYLTFAVVLAGIYYSLPFINTWLLSAQPPKPAELAQEPSALAKRYPSLPREVLASVKCRAPSFTVAPMKKKQAIYKWVDANGKTHFGDQQMHASAESIKLKQSASQRFALTINDQQNAMPLDFRDQLEVRIRKNYTVVNELLPPAMLKDANVQLWVFKSLPLYEHFKQKHAPGLVGASNGFHSGNDNIAAVLYKKDKQLMRTAIHEAAHVINLAVLGNTPRWLNEGLAEYLERMKVYSQTAEIEPNKGWLKDLRKSRMPLDTLLSSTQDDWNTEQRSSLYAHSWAFVFYLLSQSETKTLFKDYLAEAAKQPCETLDFIQFASTRSKLNKLSAGFERWQPQLATAHVY
ncbi:MAG: DUF1570 domain-containing protein [Pseudomonadales bacterium]